MTTRFNTSHFLHLQAATAYYAAYGFNAQDVKAKHQRGEIQFGDPQPQPGERVGLIPAEGRYYIEAPL